MQRRLVVLALMLMAALVVGSAVALAGGGNSANAKLCQKDGWQLLQTSTGGSFASQDACVSDGAIGDTLYGPAVTVTHIGCVVVFVGSVAFNVDRWTFSLTGFTPDSQLTVTFNGESEVIQKTDDSGSATHSFQALPVLAGSTFTETFTDADGVHASATFGPILDCPTG